MNVAEPLPAGTSPSSFDGFVVTWKRVDDAPFARLMGAYDYAQIAKARAHETSTNSIRGERR